MKPLFFFLSFFLLPHLIPAQLRDDFSDGDFTNAPAWEGDRDLFTVDAGRLRLNDPAPGSTNEAVLTVAAGTQLDRPTVWEFFAELDFAPSAGNFARVYLCAGQEDLRMPQTAYYLQIGGISGDGDALVLYRQDGAGATPLVSGAPGRVGPAPARARIRITRDTAARWEIWADYDGGTNFQLEGAATDRTYASGRYFGFYCRYSSTRAQSFAFDDVLIDPIVSLDTIPAEPGDLLITEIMADPVPGLGALPEAEYLELYNRSGKVIQLAGLTISAGGSDRPLPEFRLLPGAYVTLCEPPQAEAFAAFGDAAPVPGFPGLTNSGATLVLKDPNGNTVLQQSYRNDWYRDPGRSEGGWALELIDPAAPGSCAQNWIASPDPRGGTPGRPNAAAGLSLENIPPTLLRAAALNPLEILLIFNEPLDTATAADARRYFIAPATEVVQASPQEPDFREVLIVVKKPLQAGVVYTVTAGPALPDCLGNAEENVFLDATFGLSEPMTPGDLAINELLFQPQTGGKDFIELYNRSNKILDLENLVLLNAGRGSGPVLTQVSAPFLLFPNEFVVLTENPDDLISRYTVANHGALLATDLPSLDSDAGNLTLRWKGTTIDSFDYDDAMHSPLLASTRGVSLERIDPSAPTQSRGNWHSAAETVGFATPTYRNSQFLALAKPSGDFFELSNPRFSPDSDGFEDVLLIPYQTDRPGYALNAIIFDAQGRPVRRLADNLLLATEGVLQWDGANDDGARARVGIYVIWFELFAPDGTVSQQRKTCVLAGRLGG